MTESEAKIMRALINLALDAPVSALADAILDHLTEMEPVACGTCVACAPANFGDLGVAERAFDQALADQARLNWLDHEDACWSIRHHDSKVAHLSADGPIRQVIDFCMKIKGEE